MARYQLLCPAYCLMPDHAHFVWMGMNPQSDQKKAASFFRRATNRVLSPEKWQQEAYDSVLREEQRKRGAFQTVCRYVLENPARCEPVACVDDYAYAGAMVPGFPDLAPHQEDFWDVFWRIYNERMERDRSAP